MLSILYKDVYDDFQAYIPPLNKILIQKFEQNIANNFIMQMYDIYMINLYCLWLIIVISTMLW